MKFVRLPYFPKTAFNPSHIVVVRACGNKVQIVTVDCRFTDVGFVSEEIPPHKVLTSFEEILSKLNEFEGPRLVYLPHFTHVALKKMLLRKLKRFWEELGNEAAGMTANPEW